MVKLLQGGSMDIDSDGENAPGGSIHYNFEVQQNYKYLETGRFLQSHLLSFHFLSKDTILPRTWREI